VIVVIIKILIKLTTELKRVIAETESEIAKQSKQVEYWTRYKDSGQHDHATLVRTLEQEVDDMNTSFNEMKGEFRFWFSNQPLLLQGGKLIFLPVVFGVSP
jgi:hypothetical protein